jgi:hypothetical protein
MSEFTSAISEGFRFLNGFEVFGIPMTYILVATVILSMIGRFIRGKK